MSKKIAVIVGSLRKDSFSKKMASILISLAPASLKCDVIDISQLPLYNQDFDDHGPVPTAYTTFREQMKSYDGVLFVTPEYNRSVPGALKNVIDVGSRPYGKSIWGGKPAAILSISPGAIGGFGANHHLRQSLVFLDMPLLQQPEAYIGQIGDLIAENGSLKKEDLRPFLQSFMNAFAVWVEKITG